MQLTRQFNPHSGTTLIVLAITNDELVKVGTVDEIQKLLPPEFTPGDGGSQIVRALFRLADLAQAIEVANHSTEE